jgi:hypothetical protein
LTPVTDYSLVGRLAVQKHENKNLCCFIVN